MRPRPFAPTSLVFPASLVAVAVVVLTVCHALTSPSAAVYRALVPHTASLPGMGLVAEIAILLLIAMFAWAAWSVRGGPYARISAILTGGVGVVVAYLASELVKTVVTEERPCRAEVVLAECPEVGDWSFPSNHTGIAFGLAAAVGILVPRLLWAALPVAALAGAARVLQGAHYPHDVVAGAAWGLLVTVAVAILLNPVTATAVRSLATSNPLVAQWIGRPQVAREPAAPHEAGAGTEEDADTGDAHDRVPRARW
ncbi:phosphatase PAP2 family protein [Rhodococcus sp. HNM0569]|uniref:phosphatase PAP2 family protein n=1 Tax=Rhodococcus sp. HNM0569 TaxID=2716340 RepID=UPI00146C6C8B|nr:phosphatase PAP2 family protein [Rhodococcus sp. HNM0569]NLU84177.1 phosphatase PAP2 family protein [Rhodococcus sp. HNM0569]